MRDEPPALFDKPQNVKRTLRIFFTLCVAVLLSDLVYERHVVHSWENLWGFFALFGFVACAVLVLAAKEMRKVVMRREDYYDH